MNPRLISARFPYIPMTVTINQVSTSSHVLLDTGFDGDVIVPRHLAATAGAPNSYEQLILADGSAVYRPLFLGTADLGPLGTFPVEVVALGAEYLMGRGLADRFRIVLDHGRQIIVEP